MKQLHLFKLLDTLEKYNGLISIISTLILFMIGILIEQKTRKIQTTLTWKEFREPIIIYSNEVISALSEAAALCDADPEKLGRMEFWNRYNSILAKLTAHIDQGRLVIPNLFLEDNSAYGGKREKAIDCIVAGYNIAKAINWENCGFNKTPLKDKANSQIVKIVKAIEKLPNKTQIGLIESNPKFKGWSCKFALIEVKRQFVDEISNLVQARQWVNDIKELSKYAHKNS